MNVRYVQQAEQHGHLDRFGWVENFHSGTEHGIAGDIFQDLTYNYLFCRENIEGIEHSAKKEVINYDFCGYTTLASSITWTTLLTILF